MSPLLLAAALAATPAPPAAAEVDTARVAAHVRALASDAFEGRGPGTAGEAKTVEYIVREFRRLGLKPAGDGGGWTQAVTLSRFQTRTPTTLAYASGGRVTPLAYADQAVVQSRQPGVRHVGVKDAPLVFVGYGVSAPERGWDDYKGVDLHGKVAVVLVNDPDFATPEPGRFDGRAMTYYGRWTYKYEELARRGALGVLIVHETPAAGYAWYVVRNSWSTPQFDIPRDPKERARVEGWLTRQAAADLLKAGGQDYDLLKSASQKADFRPVELRGVTFSTEFDVETSTVVSRNVLARRVGAERPGEAVLYGAHWDHLGVGGADTRGDTIYNGAADNASGVGGLLEIARLFAKGPAPRRTVIFAAWTAEEKGLLGSEFYAAHPATPLGRTVANLNMDMLPIYGATRDVVVVGAGKGELEDDLKRLAAVQGRTVSPEPTPEAGGYFRSDHFSLAKAGVPALDFKAGPDLVNGGVAAGRKAAADFNSAHYHQPSDEMTAEWNLDGARQDLELLYGLGRELVGPGVELLQDPRELADGRRWPQWRAGAEFKPARDRTEGERRAGSGA